MNPDCQRWAELADLDALGEPVPSDGRAFQRAHQAVCAECEREAAIWRAMKVQDEPAPVDDAEVDKILSLADIERQRRVFLSRRWKGALVFMGGVAACAAAVFLWVSGRATQARLAETETHAIRTPATTAPSAAPSPAPRVPSDAPPVNDVAEAHCSRVVPGATVCLARGAVLARQVLSGAHRELEVAQGRAVVALAPQAPGTSFSLTTASGKVTAVGTIFSLEVGSDGGAVARVVEGKVLVRAGAEDTAHAVHAGQAFRLGEQQPIPLSDQDRDLDLELLSMADANDPSAAPSAPKPAPAAHGGGQTRPRDMLEYARSLRASGDSRGAADVYRKIHSDSPQSASGRAALVSLGELLLTLGDPQGALNAFDSYLVSRGALTQEAMFGRVRALRAAKRTAEERTAIQRFLAAYPDAPQSRVLRARLAAIEK